MNYLAHLYLADPEPHSLLGNVLGDFVQGVDPTTLPAGVQAGIRRHRAVDAFTDAHPICARSRARFDPRFRRFGRVLVDVFYDHFLARDWPLWHPTPLERFAASVYGCIRDNAHWLPERLRRAAPHMARENWLVSYRTIDGIESVLRRMAGRLRRETPLQDGARELRAHHAALAADFAAFFPELVAFVRAAPRPGAAPTSPAPSGPVGRGPAPTRCRPASRPG